MGSRSAGTDSNRLQRMVWFVRSSRISRRQLSVSPAKSACDDCCPCPRPLWTASDGSCECRGASAYTQSQSSQTALPPLPSFLQLLPPLALKSVQYFSLGSLAKLRGKTSGYCKGNGMLSLINMYQLGFVNINSTIFVAIRTIFHLSMALFVLALYFTYLLTLLYSAVISSVKLYFNVLIQ